MNESIKHPARPSGRKFNELSQIKLTPHFAKHAEGSCLVEFGDTHVLCTASIDERVPSIRPVCFRSPFFVGNGRDTIPLRANSEVGNGLVG